jgi:hypothetical protein
MSGQDIAIIASSGVMGLATVFLLIVLRQQTTPSRHIWASVLVIALGAIVQLVTIYVQRIMTFQTRVQVELTPTPEQFALYLPIEIGQPIKARPLLWLSGSDPSCRQHLEGPVPRGGCPSFSQAVSLANAQDIIHVSVDGAMQEMRDRIYKMTNEVRRLNATTRAYSQAIATEPEVDEL